MWTVVTYVPSAIFSLKPASATSSGGKTLLTPTPFSIKMALLDAAIRTRGTASSREWWPIIRDLRVRMELPDGITVINTFTKIVRPKKNGPTEDRGTGLVTLLGSTIAYREYVHYGGPISVAVQTGVGAPLPLTMRGLFAQINYFGKRGGFMQLRESARECDDAFVADDARWVDLTVNQSSFAVQGTLQMLDDCGAKMSFDQADIYSEKRIALNKERVLRHIVLPYSVYQSSRGYTYYRRLEAAS